MDLLINKIAKSDGRIIVKNQLIMEFSEETSGKKIHLNIDATYQFYLYGITILEGKLNALKILEERYDTHVTMAYKNDIIKVKDKMDEIENRPQSYLSGSINTIPDLKNLTQYSNLKFMSNVPTQTSSVIQMQADEMLEVLHEESVRQEKFLEKYKTGIKELTKADESIALLFDSYIDGR